MASGFQLNALDMRGLEDLKRVARSDKSPEALKSASRQFEAMFLQMVIKSMRDATPKNGLFDSDQTRMFQQLQDQQLALEMAHGRGTGLADTIYRQLGGKGSINGPVPAEGEQGNGTGRVFDVKSIPRRTAAFAAGERQDAAAGTPSAADSSGSAFVQQALQAGRKVADNVVREASSVAAGARGFVRQVWNHAVEASERTGIPPKFMVAQAALETGWGRAVLSRADGTSSHNIFNIKAGSSWKGDVVEVPVTEYANGRAYTETARFRAYGSYAEAFRDYANLIANSSRYSEVVGATDAADFARGLQQAGYATDPRYADKLQRIISGNTLKVALSG